MDLWVRSQDKEKLGKICLIEYSKDDYGYHLFGWHDKFDGHSLGTYKSKERALEILDEIQNILNPRLFVNVRPSEEMTELLGGLQHGKILKMKNDFEYKEISTCVYEMPEE